MRLDFSQMLCISQSGVSSLLKQSPGAFVSNLLKRHGGRFHTASVMGNMAFQRDLVFFPK